MPLKIGQFLGRTVLVSIPALFSDGVARPYTLAGFELHGLWLQSDDLSQRLLSEGTRDLAQAAPAVFVPFAQIAGVLVPTALAADLPPGTAGRACRRRRRSREPARGGLMDQLAARRRENRTRQASH